MKIENIKQKNRVFGISVCNPVDIEREYLLYTVDYAIKHKMNHIQFIGPIHNAQKGNVDGMTIYRKYSAFNDEKDMEFAEKTLQYVNEASLMTKENGIKSYVWHHELEVPAGFIDAYPEILNKDGDVEVTHPIIKDFLENKIEDFFYEYPNIDGLILTLHETRIPLLKLKNQKLSPVERVRYVTEILYESCKKLGKELIVRPFASIEKDYEEMLKAYASISSDLVVMDKWTQFDWSLTAPHNAFFKKVTQNPLFIETDIFGEFFGQGHLPLMLKRHIREKIEYCEKFKPLGYVSRIDRFGKHPFGGVNEVNIEIMNAYMKNENVEDAINSFYKNMYSDGADGVRALMERTEDVLTKILYINGYYFSELSNFPTLNHSKNHFYFEIMKENCDIASDEWFIPKNWEKGSSEDLLKEKDEAVAEAEELLAGLEKIKADIPPAKYEDLWEKFVNLKYAACAWRELLYCFMHYSRFFESKDTFHKDELMKRANNLISLHKEGKKLLGNRFYCRSMGNFFQDKAGNANDDANDLIPKFVDSLFKSFEYEEKTNALLSLENLTDYIICGGANEGHRLKKEVNFSDTLIINDELLRIPGNMRGAKWSTVNTHGWFSYEVDVTPKSEQTICLTVGSASDILKLKVTVDGLEYIINEEICGKKEIVLPFAEKEGNESVRIRIDRTAKETPYIYLITVKPMEGTKI